MSTQADDDQLELFGDDTPSGDSPSVSSNVTGTKTMGHKPRKTSIAAKNLRKAPPPQDPPSSRGDDGGPGELDASLGEETRRRYLNYALSVITSRALPDVRDGLKPVQRRILYAMVHDEGLAADSKHRKSAKVVGAVIGRYHPHGDSAVYDAMVRMAQDFSLRVPLVDGSGNFGSIDGDRAAAYRYTEARISAPAMELLAELKQETVPFRDNYDGTATEPVVLPARWPNLLVNGSTGIAVGMATNIPPHNLREVTNALIALAGDRAMTTTNILKHIKGPDFPTGGQMLNSKVELREIYETGTGAIRVRGEYKVEDKRRGSSDIIVTSIPYGVTKATIVEKIAEIIIGRKVPQLVDVRDESTTDVRIVLECKKGTDPAMVMAYLFKHTPLQLNFNMNVTALVPVPGTDVGRPEKLGIKAMLEHFLDFRYEVTQKRFEFELEKLRKRIHILEGFEVIFDALDEAIRIIRRSDGRKDAAQKLMKRFELDEIQVGAILELRLYKLAKLEILAIREELKEKRAEAARIEAILASSRRLWGVVKSELAEVAEAFGTPRRTRIGALAEEIEFNEDAYILDEDAHVVVTKDGWLKRLREVKDPKTTRVREGDAVMAVLPGSTKENVIFFTNKGSAYVTRINDIPPTTGYGDPAQKLFKFKDGERIVAAYSLDERLELPEELLAISESGYGLRFDLEAHSEVTTRTGRRYARPAKNDDIIDVVPVQPEDVIVVATAKGHVLLCEAEEVNKLEGPGKGVRVIKVASDDGVIGFIAGSRWKEHLEVETAKGGKKFRLHADSKRVTSRGGKGHQIVKRSTIKLSDVEVTIPSLGEEE